MSQNNEILEYLSKGNTLTSLEALSRFQCFRLASRINDIKAKGYQVMVDMVSTASNKKVAQYSMKREGEMF